MKILYTFSLLICIISPVFSQSDPKSDSIRTAISMLSDKERMEKYDSIFSSVGNSRNRAMQALAFADESIQLAKKLNDRRGLLWIKIEIVNSIGLTKSREEALDSLKKIMADVESLKDPELLFHALLIKGNQLIEIDSIVEATGIYQQSLNIAKEIPDSTLIAVSYNNLGNVSNILGRSSEAIEYYLNSLKIKELQGSKTLAATYNNVSQIYKDIGAYEESLIFNRKAMKLQKENNNLFGLSISYLNMGNTLRRMEQYDSALNYHEQALGLSREIKDTLGFAFAYVNMASVYYSMEDYEKSTSYFIEAAELFEKYGMRANTVHCYHGMSVNYRYMGEYRKAKEAIDFAWEKAEGLTSYSLRQNLTNTYYELYKITGQYKLALDYFELYKAYSDSILNESKVEEIGRLKKDYDIANRDNQIVLLERDKDIASLKMDQQKSVRNWLFLVIVLIILLSIILYNGYRRKIKSELSLREKNKELEELNATKDKFFAIIAHDLRNPLSAFKMLTTGLKENINHFSEEEINEQLESLSESSNQLTDLLQNLLQWALSQTETLKINPQVINMRNLLETNLKLIDNPAREKNIELDVHLSDDLRCTVDQATMDLVFRNILSNALKFTDKNGKIKVSGSVENEFVKISIQDNGIGISKEDHDLLFDISKDPGKVGSSPNKGTGLGLILCNEFVKKNQGHINLESDYGKGSTFIVYVPRHLNQAA